MSSSLSIISTLQEAFQLGVRYWRLVLGVSLITAIFLTLQGYFSVTHHSLQHPAIMVFSSFALVTFGLIIDAMTTAATLGVLKSPRNDAGYWPTIVSSVRTYTGTLVRLSLLLAIIAMVVVMPISFSIAFFHMPKAAPSGLLLKFLLAFIAILYLVFIKFALANPLVVVEGKTAIGAIAGSWEMTKGRFGYVLGCYVFLAATNYFVDAGLGHFHPGSFDFIVIIRHLVGGLWGCLWNLMAWCMYQRIKALETKPEILPITAN